MNIHENLYQKMKKLGFLDFRGEHIRLKASGFMDLVIENLYTDKDGRKVMSLSHYYKMNGDQVPDPDMEIRVDHKLETVEALTYQDIHGFWRVYHERGLMDVKAKKSLNMFLLKWLSNLKAQAFRYVKENTPVPGTGTEE